MLKTHGSDRDLEQRYGPSQRTWQRLRAEGGGPRWSRAGARRVIYAFRVVEVWLAERSFETRAAELARRAQGQAVATAPRRAKTAQNPH